MLKNMLSNKYIINLKNLYFEKYFKIKNFILSLNINKIRELLTKNSNKKTSKILIIFILKILLVSFIS